MTKSPVRFSHEGGFEGADTLWTFLTAISGVRDELERARLTATFVPSVVPCRVSGVALIDQAGGDWLLVAPLKRPNI